MARKYAIEMKADTCCFDVIAEIERGVEAQ